MNKLEKRIEKLEDRLSTFKEELESNDRLIFWTLVVLGSIAFIVLGLYIGSVEEKLQNVPHKVCRNETIIENIGVNTLYYSYNIVTSGIDTKDCKIVQVSNLSSINCIKVKEVCSWE